MKLMRKHMTALYSVCYSIGQIGFGLLVHPYQTMQLLVEGKVFVWMTLLPTIILAMTTVIWRYSLVPLILAVFVPFFEIQTIEQVKHVLEFFSDWITLFLLFWQIVLFYLLVRFWQTFDSDDEITMN